MTYTPPATGAPDPLVLSSMTDDTVAAMAFSSNAALSGAWSANLAGFYPVRLSQARTYVKAWWLNGATAAGNIDVGIYTLSGTTMTRVVASVAEAQGTISTLQVAASFATTTVGPGLYYLALSSTSGSSTLWQGSLQGTYLGKAAGFFQASSASPLPSSVTVSSYGQFARFPMFGFSEVAAI